MFLAKTHAPSFWRIYVPAKIRVPSSRSLIRRHRRSRDAFACAIVVNVGRLRNSDFRTLHKPIPDTLDLLDSRNVRNAIDLRERDTPGYPHANVAYLLIIIALKVSD